MDAEQPPDLGNRDLDTSSTDDKIRAYNAVANSLSGSNPAGCFLDTCIPAEASYSHGGGLSISELGSDSQPVLPD